VTTPQTPGAATGSSPMPLPRADDGSRASIWLLPVPLFCYVHATQSCGCSRTNLSRAVSWEPLGPFVLIQPDSRSIGVKTTPRNRVSHATIGPASAKDRFSQPLQKASRSPRLQHPLLVLKPKSSAMFRQWSPESESLSVIRIRLPSYARQISPGPILPSYRCSSFCPCNPNGLISLDGRRGFSSRGVAWQG
jgi:hypothetical protein